MNELKKEQYMEYRKAVFSLIQYAEKEFSNKAFETSIDYYEHWEHALALDDMLSIINKSHMKISSEFINNINKTSNKFLPDGYCFKQSTLNAFNNNYNN